MPAALAQKKSQNMRIARNLERYGNKIGPAFDDLVKKGKNFDQIIESSTRAGGGDLFQ